MNKLVAVYGSLRKGLGNHRVLGGSELLWVCETPPHWEMFSLGGFPGIRAGEGPITIEVYRVVSESVAYGLDSLEGYRGPNSNNNFYDKCSVDTDFGSAEIYTLLKGYEDCEAIDGGDWLEYHGGNNR